MTHLIVGCILTGLGIWGVIAWWNVFGLVMRGVVPLGLLLLGLAALLSGLRRGAHHLHAPEEQDAAYGSNGARDSAVVDAQRD